VQTEVLLLLVNGRVWTVNPAQPEAEAVAISGNRIVAVGANSEILSLSGSAAQTRIIDLRGRLVVPGFNDAHLHFYMGGDSLRSVNLRGATGHPDLRQKIGEYASTRRPGEWILNGNWNDQSWDPAELPFHQLIDDVTEDNPVFVHRSDGHMSLANRVAMQIAGVDRSTSEVPGGEIVRDTNGDPTGVFKDTAKALIERVIPRPSQEYILQCLRAAQSYAIENGVTSVQDMGVLGKRGGDTMADVLRAYQRLLHDGELKVRVSGHLPLPEWKRLADAGVMAGFGDEKLRIGATKSFSDGSLGSTTAWFFDPYTDAPQTCGLPSNEMVDGEAMYRNLCDADRAGLQLVVHAIGDRANRTVLDMMERLTRENGVRDRRWRIEHAQHLQPSDIKRFGQLGVIASVQPYHAIDDGPWAERRIGPDRVRSAFAFRSLLDAGAVLALGSDWWVAPIDPLLTIHAAVTRQLAGGSEDGWVPEQRISVKEAVFAYTMGSAYASGEEEIKGSIGIGKLADLAVLSKDIFSIDASEIRKTKVEMTIFDGTIVFEREARNN
jgi:predicted amidohydrolase YtcJ